MRNQTVIFVALVSILSMIINTSNARDFDDLQRDGTYMIQVIDCVLGTAACDEYGEKVKALIPEALNNNCKRCNPEQKRKFKLMSAFMKMAYPDQWQQIQEKYYSNRYIHADY
uniref:Chemosensory protein n=2 Tax=Meteorus pulchricornis TaxID=51522 RepID=A0A1S5VFJ0_9HYME